MQNPTFLAGLNTALLGSERNQRIRAYQNLLSLSLIVTFAAMQQVEVLWGLIDSFQSNCLTAFNVGSSLICYLLIRSGLNRRIAPTEPSLTLLQTGCAVTAVCWSYAITGPARGAVLGIFILIIQFGGLFQLRPAQTRGLVLYALGLLAALMVWRTHWAAETYDARVEIIHFVFACIVLTGAAVISIRIGKLRARLSAQKGDLEKALELNRMLATRDPLTGLLNRRAMADVLAQCRAGDLRGDHHSERRFTHHQATIAMIDIDHFKRVNDTLGHAIGDAVLQRFADIINSGIRNTDVLARWGGEEFLLLMPGTGRQGAAQLMATIQRMITAGEFECLAPGMAVTFSAGIAEMADGEDYSLALERADQALYRAKCNGRDRIEHASGHLLAELQMEAVRMVLAELP